MPPADQIQIQGEGLWRLQQPDGVIRSVSRARLIEMAESAAVEATDRVSLDGQTWRRAPDVPDLKMEWVAYGEDGRRYGPFNMLAAPALARRGILTNRSVIRRIQQELRKRNERLVRDVDALRGRVAELESRLRGRDARPAPEPHGAAAWYVRTADGHVYGPSPLSELQEWARNCRLGPADEVSRDRDRWMPAYRLQALGMEWEVSLDGGEYFGPVHLMAVRHLHETGAIHAEARLRRAHCHADP